MNKRIPYTTAMVSVFFCVASNADTAFASSPYSISPNSGGNGVSHLSDRDAVKDFLDITSIWFMNYHSDPTDITEIGQSLIYSGQNQSNINKVNNQNPVSARVQTHVDRANSRACFEYHENKRWQDGLSATGSRVRKSKFLSRPPEEINTSIYKLAQQNFDAAIAWAESLDKNARDEARLTALLALYWHSQVEALALSKTLLSTQQRDEFLSVVALDLPAYDMQLALSFFDQANKYTQYDMAFPIAYELGNISVDDSHHWLTQLRSTDARANALRGLIDSAMHSQPDMVLVLVGEFEQLTDQKSIENLYARIAMENQHLVEHWLHSGVLSHQQNRMLRQLLRKIDLGEFEDLDY